MRIVHRLVISAAMALTLMAQEGWSQPPDTRPQKISSTFEELREKLRNGETVQVTEAAGTTYKARIAELSEKLSVIMPTGARRDLTESEVREIRRRRGDAVWNGLLIGMGVGLAAGVAFGTGEACESGQCVASSVLAFSGIGAGAGTLIDLAIRKHETSFEVRPRTYLAWATASRGDGSSNN
jgi:hypothetical protein